jgi:hypothetical protein
MGKAISVRVGGTGCTNDTRCPDRFRHLLEQPADLDDTVAVLRWALACHLVSWSMSKLARVSRVDADRIVAFLDAPARQAGQLLTFAEGARLARAVERRLEDRELGDSADLYWEVAAPYVEVEGVDFNRAIRRAREVRRAYRAAHPGAATVGVD